PRPRLFLGLKKSPSRTSINRAIPAEGRWDWTAEPVCPSIADPIDGGFGLRRRSRSRFDLGEFWDHALGVMRPDPKLGIQFPRHV
ncbi:unnamed protein product, partial [Musa banksii]